MLRQFAGPYRVFPAACEPTEMPLCPYCDQPMFAAEPLCIIVHEHGTGDTVGLAHEFCQDEQNEDEEDEEEDEE